MKKQILKTSQQWLQDEPEFFNLVVHDPDGWDRKNFNYSFYKEKITLEEFRRRLLQSTSIHYKKVKHETFKPVREDAGKSV